MCRCYTAARARTVGPQERTVQSCRFVTNVIVWAVGLGFRFFEFVGKAGFFKGHGRFSGNADREIEGEREGGRGRERRRERGKEKEAERQGEIMKGRQRSREGERVKVSERDKVSEWEERARDLIQAITTAFT